MISGISVWGDLKPSLHKGFASTSPLALLLGLRLALRPRLALRRAREKNPARVLAYTRANSNARARPRPSETEPRIPGAEGR